MFWRHFAFTITWSLIILVLYLLPGSEMPSINFMDLLQPDKMAHAGFFSVLMTSLSVSIFKQNRFPSYKRKTILTAFVLSSLYGLILEFAQGLTPDRVFDVLDIAANEAGIILGIVIIRLIFKGQIR